MNKENKLRETVGFLYAYFRSSFVTRGGLFWGFRYSCRIRGGISLF